MRPDKPTAQGPAKPGPSGLVPNLLGGIGDLLNGQGGLLGPGGLLGQGGLLDLRRSPAGAPANPTGLNAQQERDLLGLLLGGQ